MQCPNTLVCASICIYFIYQSNSLLLLPWAERITVEVTTYLRRIRTKPTVTAFSPSDLPRRAASCTGRNPRPIEWERVDWKRQQHPFDGRAEEENHLTPPLPSAHWARHKTSLQFGYAWDQFFKYLSGCPILSPVLDAVPSCPQPNSGKSLCSDSTAPRFSMVSCAA